MGRKIYKPHKLPTPFFLLILLLNLPLSVRAEEPPQIELTPEEQAWLAEHPDIALGAPTTYPPFVIRNENGTYEGVLLDYMEAASQLLDQRIRLHIEDPWIKVQERAEKREIDGLAVGGKSSSIACTRSIGMSNPTSTTSPWYPAAQG